MNKNPATQKKESGKRDGRGKLVKGTPCINPKGRPTREREHALLSIMQAEATPERWLVITQRAIADAMDGDGAARSWLSRYLLPEPKHSVEVGGSLADLIASLSTPDHQHLAD